MYSYILLEYVNKRFECVAYLSDSNSPVTVRMRSCVWRVVKQSCGRSIGTQTFTYGKETKLPLAKPEQGLVANKQLTTGLRLE